MASKSGRKRRQREDLANHGPATPAPAARSPSAVPVSMLVSAQPVRVPAPAPAPAPAAVLEAPSAPSPRVAASIDLLWRRPEPASQPPPVAKAPVVCVPAAVSVAVSAAPEVLHALARLEARMESLAAWASEFSAWQARERTHRAQDSAPQTRKRALVAWMALLFLPLVALLAWRLRAAFLV